MPALLTPNGLRTVPIDPLVPTIDDVTRRGLLRGAGTLGAGWVLAGCGPDGRQATAPSPSRRTRTVQDAFGEVQVPADPQRLVVLDRRQTMPLLLSLGVVPVAAGTIDPICRGRCP